MQHTRRTAPQAPSSVLVGQNGIPSWGMTAGPCRRAYTYVCVSFKSGNYTTHRRAGRQRETEGLMEETELCFASCYEY